MTIFPPTHMSGEPNNRADFHGDPTTTPGIANDAVVVSLTSLSVNNGLATAATTGVACRQIDTRAQKTRFGSPQRNSGLGVASLLVIGLKLVQRFHRDPPGDVTSVHGPAAPECPLHHDSEHVQHLLCGLSGL